MVDVVQDMLRVSELDRCNIFLDTPIVFYEYAYWIFYFIFTLGGIQMQIFEKKYIHFVIFYIYFELLWNV